MLKSIQKKHIKDVQNYFIKMIVEGKYEVAKIEDYFHYITVDNEYTFILWIGYFADSGIETTLNSFMGLSFTREESEIINANLSEYKKEADTKNKMAEYEALKKELGK